MLWPPCSHDMSSIEYLWEVVETCICMEDLIAANMKELGIAIEMS